MSLFPTEHLKNNNNPWFKLMYFNLDQSKFMLIEFDGPYFVYEPYNVFIIK